MTPARLDEIRETLWDLRGSHTVSLGLAEELLAAVDGLRNFVERVREMRAAQQTYFAKRTKENLVAAKLAEQRVDGILKSHTKEKKA